MEGFGPSFTFADLGRLDEEFIRSVLWRDLFRQHRLPEELRLSVRTWAAAISHAPMYVANKLTSNAPPDVRTKIGSIVVYERPSLEEALTAQELIVRLYARDLERLTGTSSVHETRGAYAEEAPSEVPEQFAVSGIVMLDTRGVRAALQFASAAATVFALESNEVAVQNVYRTVMDIESDSLRVALGTPEQVSLPTGRVQLVRSRGKDFANKQDVSNVMGELTRLLCRKGYLVIEDLPEEVDRLCELLPDLDRRSPRVAVLQVA